MVASAGSHGPNSTFGDFLKFHIQVFKREKKQKHAHNNVSAPALESLTGDYDQMYY
jgi:hypothetical protein